MIILVTGIPGIGKGTQCKLLAQQEAMVMGNQASSSSTTQQLHNFIHVSSGDLLRREKQNTSTPLGKYIRDNWSYQKMSDIVFALIKQELMKYVTPSSSFGSDNSNTVSEPVFLLDATPRTLDDCRKFDRIFHIDAVLSFEPSKADQSPDFLVKRLKGRLIHTKSGRTYHETMNPPLKHMKDDVTGEALEKRDDDSDQAIRARLNKYEKETQPIIDNYFGSCRHNLKRIYVSSSSSISEINKQVLEVIQSIYQEKSIRKENLHGSNSGPFKTKSIVENYGCSEIMFFEPFYDMCLGKMSALVRSSKHKHRFPGTNVIPLNKDYLAQVISPHIDRYRIFPKLDGTRFFLLMLKSHQKVVLIDRALNLFDASNMFDSRVLKDLTRNGDSLLDGEFLILRRKQPLFVILDSLYVNGTQIKSVNNMEKRLEEVKKFDNSIFRSTDGKITHDLEHYIKVLQNSSKSTRNASPTTLSESDPLRLHLCIQRGYLVSDIRKLLQFVKLLDLEDIQTDGIVFSKIDEPYRYGLTKESFKWKPLNKMTIDFELSYDQNTGKYNLLTWNEKTKHYEVYDVLADTTEDYSHLDGIVVECLYDPNAVTTVNEQNVDLETCTATITIEKARSGQKRKRLETIEKEHDRQPGTHSDSSNISTGNKNKRKKGGWILVHERYDKLNPNPLWCVTNFMNEIHTLYIHNEQELCALLLNE